MIIRNAVYKNTENTIVDVEIEHPKHGWIPYTFKSDEVDESLDSEIREYLKTVTIEDYVEIPINIVILKKAIIVELIRAQDAELSILLGDTAEGEPDSFTIQEKEARTWNFDNLEPTPFIDALLIGRSNGETKQELVDKIIAKADAYAIEYASMLGKFHKLVVAVDSATTTDEVTSIVW